MKSIAKIALEATFPVTERLLAAAYHRRLEQARLIKPIIVVGPDRSGTSLVYALLANHPDLYAPTTIADRFPKHPLSATLLRKISSWGAEDNFSSVPDTNGVIAGGRHRLTEAVRYWIHHLGSRDGGWKHAPDDFFSEEDLDDNTRRVLPADLKKRLTVMQKRRLVVKQPGFSLKIRYLNALFPDAIFVHSLRHPVDNFHSLMAQKQETENPSWGVRIPGWQAHSHLSIEAQTAHQLAGTYKIILQSVAQIGGFAAGRYVPVRYESFHAAFADEVQMLFQGCELEVPAVLLQKPENYVRPGNSHRQPKALPADPIARKILEKLALEMGYANEPAVPTAGSAS